MIKMAAYRSARRTFNGTELSRFMGRLWFRLNSWRFKTESVTFYQSRRRTPFDDIVLGIAGPDNSLLYGEYERPVLDWLAEAVTPETDFWEIGARFGYFSFTVCQIAASVTAVEARPETARLLRMNREANAARNVSVIEGRVPDEIVLGDHTPPDIALIDIEGKELDALETAGSWLGETTFVIELHRWADYTEDELIALLGNHGYQTSVLDERGGTKHIVAE